MAALITAGGTDATNTLVVSGSVKLIVSGVFSGNASLNVEIESDSLRAAPIHNFRNEGAISIDSVTGQTLTVTVNGGDASTSIDVTAI